MNGALERNCKLQRKQKEQNRVNEQQSNSNTNTVNLHNGHRNLDPSAKATTLEPIINGKICSMCGNSEKNLVLDLSSNHLMKERLQSDWKMPPQLVKSTLTTICIQCVYKLNMHTDVTRSLVLKLHRVSNGHNNVQAHTSIYADKKEFISNNALTSNTEKDCDPSESFCQNPKITIKSKLEERQISIDSNVGFSNLRSCSPNSPNTQNSETNLSMLQVFRECSESISVTESGGKINRYKTNRRFTIELKCPHCPSIYWRKDHFNRHMRRCSQRARWLQSRSVKSCRSQHELEESPKTDDGNAERVANMSRVFRCTNCSHTATNLIELRRHERQNHRKHQRHHRQHYRCELCHSEFSTNYEYEIHYVVCSAKRIVEESETDSKTVPRMTRARSRAISFAQTSFSQHDVDNDNVECDDDDDDVESANEIYDVECEDDDDDDDVSVADSMYSKRMRFTGNWIENHSNSNSTIDLTTLDDYDFSADELQITSHMEYDLYLLDRFKMQVSMNTYSCLVPLCEYRTDRMLDILKHDYTEHWKKSFFYCNKCGGMFTSKVFLDYHLDRQNSGDYVCIKCHDLFKYQHQLDKHLLRHMKNINFCCNYCHLEFLNENKLLQHCYREQHSPTDERNLIRIERSMTISNPVRKPAIREFYKYETRVIDMKTMPMPSKRPMQLPNHKPYRRFIGLCIFTNNQAPNCVACL